MEKTLGQIAYEAYCESTGGVSLISGAPLPTFDQQHPAIKIAWEAAAEAADAASQARRIGRR